jgi:hypothetical protein
LVNERAGEDGDQS